MKVLIADDEPQHLLTVEALLKERGYSVVLASNGEEAFKKAVDTLPDLAILDIMMPVMDGTEAALRIRNHPATKNIPIFFITAAISPEEMQGMEHSANLIFAKPVKFYELLDAIKKIETKKN